MDYHYFILLGIAACLSIKEEKIIKRKKLSIGIYSVITVGAILYFSGKEIGKFIYYITHI